MVIYWGTTQMGDKNRKETLLCIPYYTSKFSSFMSVLSLQNIKLPENKLSQAKCTKAL